MLAQSLSYLGQGIVLLIGILLFTLFAGTALLVVSVILRIYLFRRRQQHARQAYLRETRRADGRPYPPRTGGVCDHCAKVKGTIYYPASGEKLCPQCYEAWWPTNRTE